MAIRNFTQNVASFTDDDELGAGSVAGGIGHTFMLPLDTDSVTIKMTASVEGAYSAVLQTTDDGGTTWYDVGRTSIVSNANGTTAEWLTVPVAGFGYKTATISSTVATGSVVATGPILQPTGSAAASSLGQKSFSGLPIMNQLGRVFIRITGDVANVAYNTVTAKVMTGNQSASHN